MEAETIWRDDRALLLDVTKHLVQCVVEQVRGAVVHRAFVTSLLYMSLHHYTSMRLTFVHERLKPHPLSMYVLTSLSTSVLTRTASTWSGLSVAVSPVRTLSPLRTPKCKTYSWKLWTSSTRNTAPESNSMTPLSDTCQKKMKSFKNTHD